MRTLLPFSLSLCAALLLHGTGAAAQQQARMSVSLSASGTDSTRSQGGWSKGSFSYRAAFTVMLESDGELSDLNLYDPDYAQKALAAGAATMAKIEAARNGQFSDEEEVEPDYRYRYYMAQMDCPVTLSIEVDERLEGEYPDVGGMQPYTITFTARSTGNEVERSLLCIGSSSVLDVKDGVLYRSGLGFPEVTGHYVQHEANRGKLQDDPEARQSALPPVLSDYLFNTLRVAPARGQQKTTLELSAPPQSRIDGFEAYQGSMEVELSWDFELLE